MKHISLTRGHAVSLVVAAVTVSASLLPAYKTLAATSSCATSIAPSTGAQTVSDAYTQWKKTYVTSSGASGNLRVQRSANDNYDTVSEGIAYGMLFAAYNNDKTTFDSLWAYEQTHLDGNGLMNWQINGGGGTNGYNAATDADEDMAIGLVAADKAWGGYTTAAKHQIQLIRTTEIESGSSVVKPGDVWGGSNQLNPSYIAPAYYDVFQSYTGDTSWSQVKTAGYQTLANSQAKNGLIPDWGTTYGGESFGMSHDYGYDAVRSPLRLATASAWSCDSTATADLTNFNTTFSTIGANNVVDGYHLDATPYGSNPGNSIFVAPMAAAATTSSDSAYRTAVWNKLASNTTSGYYGDSLRMYSLLISSGKFVSPLTLSTPTPEPSPVVPTPTPTPSPTPAPTTPTTTSINIWWPSNGSAVTGTQPFKAMIDDKSVADYVMYWQVDGGVLNLMTDNDTDYPHKQTNVNVTGWNWRGAGPYKITFVAKDADGATIATSSTNITIK